jgi:hypothetical protein
MVKVMIKLRTVTSIFVMLILALTLVKSITAQTSDETQTFVDSEIPGIKIQVNATAETQPSQNITVALNLKPQTTVEVTYFNLSIFGFINGTYKTLMANITDSDFSLYPASKEYTCTFKVPEQVWGVTYGEIVLTYTARYGVVTINFEKLTCGFTMSDVENIYLKNIEEKLKASTSTFNVLNQTFWESFLMNLSAENLARLNQTYWELQQNYTALQGNLNELGNTRMAVGILAVTTVFFVATTLYLVMRKPKESW